MRDEPGPGHRRTSAPLLFAGEQVQYTVVRLLKLCWQKTGPQPLPLGCPTVQGPVEPAR